MKFTEELKSKGFLRNVEFEGKNILILTTPCRIVITQKEVSHLKGKYLAEEEVGGVMWAKPTDSNGERIYIIDNIKFIRNAIEDKPIYDDNGRLLRKEDAYLLDAKEYKDELKKIYPSKFLPIRFHTHPTKGKDILSSIRHQHVQTNTSEQDAKESKTYDILGNQYLLMPRGLVVGNKDLGNDLFVGVYDGFIAPEGFEESKRKVQQENMTSIYNTISNKISSWKLDKEEKIALGVGAVLILGYLIYRTRKYSAPVIIGVAAAGSVLLNSTSTVNNPDYFNKLSFGDVDINIPKEDGEYFPQK